MTLRSLYRTGSVVMAASLAVCGVVGGFKGAAGFALGVFASLFGLAVWQVIISIIADVARSDPKPQKGSVIIVVAFLLKLPLFVAAVFLAAKLGGAARACFGVGLCEVYLALVGRLLAHDAALPS